MSAKPSGNIFTQAGRLIGRSVRWFQNLSTASNLALRAVGLVVAALCTAYFVIPHIGHVHSATNSGQQRDQPAASSNSSSSAARTVVQGSSGNTPASTVSPLTRPPTGFPTKPQADLAPPEVIQQLQAYIRADCKRIAADQPVLVSGMEELGTHTVDCLADLARLGQVDSSSIPTGELYLKLPIVVTVPSPGGLDDQQMTVTSYSLWRSADKHIWTLEFFKDNNSARGGR